MANSLEKTMKRLSEPFVKAKPSSLLYNRYVLYLVFAIALANLFVSAVNGDFIFVTFFLLVGFVMSFFTKNMMVILVLTLGVANVLKFASRGSMEGFDDKKEKEPIEDESETLPSAQSDPKKKKESKVELVEQVKSDAEQLIEAQKNIIDGFEKIDPYMKQAEGLIGEIDKTAKKIEAFNRETMRGRNN